jgi:hypothetical protein
MIVHSLRHDYGVIGASSRRPARGGCFWPRSQPPLRKRVRREPAMLFMELRGGLDEDDTPVRRPRRREIECPRPALSSALTSCAFVSFAAKALSQRRTTSYANQHAFRSSGASISMACGRLHLFLPVTANHLPAISLLWRNHLPVTVLVPVHRQSPQAIVSKMKFPRDWSGDRKFFLFLAYYQGVSARIWRQAPLYHRARSCRARFPASSAGAPAKQDV